MNHGALTFPYTICRATVSVYLIVCYALTADQADSPPYWVPASVPCRSLYWTILQANEEKAISALQQLSQSYSPYFRLAPLCILVCLREQSSQTGRMAKYSTNNAL